MKKAIFISIAIMLHVLYYLSMFGVIGVNLYESYWIRFLTAATIMVVGCILMDRYVKHVRKWLYNATYLLLLACGIALYLRYSGVYLGVYTYAILLTTIFPLIFGAYLYCDSIKKDNSWHFLSKMNCDDSLIVEKPDDIEASEPIVGRSYDSAQKLKEEHEIFSQEILQYAQGEFAALKNYMFTETMDGQIYVAIEQPTELSDTGEELLPEQENPHIYCDGSKNAILVYNSNKTLGLDYMAMDIYERVNDLKSILVMVVKLDYDKSRLIRTFYAPITKIEMPAVVEQPKPQISLCAPPMDCTRESMLAELPRSAKLSNDDLFKIKEQLIDGLHELNIEVERVQVEIGEKSVTCQLRYDTIPTAISASGFPCNINIFYRLLSIDREEKIITIDIPYKKQVA